jgi:hypothetical protein
MVAMEDVSRECLLPDTDSVALELWNWRLTLRLANHDRQRPNTFRSTVMPAARIRKFDVHPLPVRPTFRTYHIISDRPNHRHHDFGGELSRRFGQAKFAARTKILRSLGPTGRPGGRIRRLETAQRSERYQKTTIADARQDSAKAISNRPVKSRFGLIKESARGWRRFDNEWHPNAVSAVMPSQPFFGKRGLIGCSV